MSLGHDPFSELSLRDRLTALLVTRQCWGLFHCFRGAALQGYLAHNKKAHSPRTPLGP